MTNKFIRIRKVKVLEGGAKKIARDMKLNDEDLVLMTIQYKLEKIEGSPIDWLQKKYNIKKVDINNYTPKEFIDSLY